MFNTLGELAQQMRAAEAAYMADDASLLNALLVELPANAVLQQWALNLQFRREEARRVVWINSMHDCQGCAK